MSGARPRRETRDGCRFVETRCNPLALLEMPRGLTVAELAGGFGLPGTLPLEGSIENSFRRRVTAAHIPPSTGLPPRAAVTGNPPAGSRT